MYANVSYNNSKNSWPLFDFFNLFFFFFLFLFLFLSTDAFPHNNGQARGKQTSEEGDERGVRGDEATTKKKNQKQKKEEEEKFKINEEWLTFTLRYTLSFSLSVTFGRSG